MNKELSTKEIKIVKGRVQGKSLKQIGKEVYPNQNENAASVSVARVLRKASVHDAVRAEMSRLGVTLEDIILPIAKGLKATTKMSAGKENIKYNKQGKEISFDYRYKEEDNLPLQLSASDRAVKLLGLATDQSGDSSNMLNDKEVEALASASDEITLTQLVFKRQ